MKEETIEELRQLKTRALEMGGPDQVAKQHARGKLTVRERVAMLLDPETFVELGLLATHRSSRPQMEGRYTAADGMITGFGKIDGRMVCICAEDFTVLGGSWGSSGGRKANHMLELAAQEKVPMIWLHDGAGARTEESVSEGVPSGGTFVQLGELSGVVPQIGVVMGPAAGQSSLVASAQDFIIMVKGTSMMAAGGPPVVEAAIGEKVSKEELGGSYIHCHLTGVADNEAESEEQAFAMVREYLSFMPSNAWQAPPSVPCHDDPERRDPELLDLVSENRHRSYDMKELIRHVVDDGHFFEIKPDWGRSLITCFARMGGNPVGVIANQPLVLAGAIDVEAADKETHFIQLCDCFHIPLIFFADCPGAMTGSAAERTGVLRHGLRVSYALSHCSVPKIAVVIRKSYGFGAVAMCGANMGQTMLLSWPTGEFGSIPVEGGVGAAYKSQLANAEDPEALRRQLEQTFAQYGGPLRAARTFNVEDVIDPRDTRPMIIKGLELVKLRLTGPLRPRLKRGIMP